MGEFLIHTDTGQELILEHHGILGQKWGVRNGPPYPLAEGKHSSAERKAGYKSSISGSSGVSGGKRRKLIAKGPSGPIGESGFAEIRGGSESPEASLANTNPKFKDSGNCVIAYEMRRRGLDVEARGNNHGMTDEGVSRFFDNAPIESVPLHLDELNRMEKVLSIFDKSSSEQIPRRATYITSLIRSHIIEKYPDGARGAISVTNDLSGHFMSWERSGDEIIISDPQANANVIATRRNRDPEPKDRSYSYMFGTCDEINLIRTDNRKLSKDISQVVMNRGSNADAHGMEYHTMSDYHATSDKEFANVKETLRKNNGEEWDGTWQSYDDRKHKYKNKA